MTEADEGYDDGWLDGFTVHLRAGSAMSQEAAETARVLITARLDAASTPGSQLLNDEVTRQVRRIASGMRPASKDGAALTEGIEWSSYLLTALSFIAGLVAEVGSSSATGVVEGILRTLDEDIPEDARDVIERALAPGRIIEQTFNLIEQKGWTF